MALTGLDIFKNLPKENCKECGLPTCLAFAMKVASGQAGLDECPRLSDEARAGLNEASAPPQRLVKIGAGPGAIELGQETVMFRHDEKFHHPTAVAMEIPKAKPYTWAVLIPIRGEISALSDAARIARPAWVRLRK